MGSKICGGTPAVPHTVHGAALFIVCRHSEPCPRVTRADRKRCNTSCWPSRASLPLSPQRTLRTVKDNTWLNIHFGVSDLGCHVMHAAIPMPSACASPLQLTSHPAWRSRWLRRYFLSDINLKGGKAAVSGGQHVCADLWVQSSGLRRSGVPLSFISAALHRLISAGLAQATVIYFLCCICVWERFGLKRFYLVVWAVISTCMLL